MNKSLALVSIHTLVILLIFSHVSIGADLYNQEINVKAKEGKDLIMVLDEIERQDRFSIIRVKHTSGASVPSIMFVVKGCVEIAKIRGAKYFINLKEWADERGDWFYKIGFSEDESVNIETFFGDDIDKSKDLGFMSVKSYDLLLGNR